MKKARSRKSSGVEERKAEKEQKRVAEIVWRLAGEYSDATCALRHENPYQLLVATILSAQCTDARVNMVTPALFRRYPDPASLSRAKRSSLEEMIRSTGFFRNKAKSLIGACRVLVEQLAGKVPQTMEEMLQLPGVARKTANVVLGTAFGLPSGVVVDTHVKRLSQRLGLSREENPDKIEKDLMRQLPPEQWIDFAHRLIHHGRRICQAQKPKCHLCMLADLCPYYQEIVRSQ